MLRKDAVLDWDNPTTEQLEAFETLKAKLTSPPVLALPKANRPIMIDTDASQYAVGVVLLQQQDDEHPTEWATLGYWSKTLSKEQRNYSATERECYAVVWGILTLRPYLEGARFSVRTDHNALRWMMTLNDPQGRLMRWRLRLMEFNYEIVYRPGRVHQVPDALSRIPQPDRPEEDDEVDEELPTFGDHRQVVATEPSVEAPLSELAPRSSTSREAPLSERAPPQPNGPVLALTRSGRRPSSGPQPSPTGPTDTGPLPRTTPLLRRTRTHASARPNPWEDKTFIPLPDEESEVEEDAEDLLLDVQDMVRSGRHLEDVDTGVPQQDLPAPLTRLEILEEQRADDYCQLVFATQLEKADTSFFEDKDGVLCRTNPREPTLIQVVLPSSLRARVLKLAHHHPLSGHPGQTRLHRRLRRVYYWPQMAADVATTQRQSASACRARRIVFGWPSR